MTFNVEWSDEYEDWVFSDDKFAWIGWYDFNEELIDRLGEPA